MLGLMEHLICYTVSDPRLAGRVVVLGDLQEAIEYAKKNKIQPHYFRLIAHYRGQMKKALGIDDFLEANLAIENNNVNNEAEENVENFLKREEIKSDPGYRNNKHILIDNEKANIQYHWK